MELSEKKIIDITNELKARYFINPHRKIKASKHIQGGFKASVITFNTIIYDPNLSGLDDQMIRFCLLHEEGHLKRGQYGIPALFFLLGLGFVPLLYTILFNPCFLIISLFFFLFVFFSSIRILTAPFHWDEYGSDEFASKILQENYGIKKPSEIVKKTLNSIPSRFDSSNPLYRLFLAFIEYHPSTEQRIRNIAGLVDEK
jgi:Zn-dependent protease with chaperone function